MQRLFEYLNQSRSELSKVVWPSRRQAARLTGLVIGFSIALALFIGLMDTIFSSVLQKIILKG
jgi:preprotein translocase subunit SecE